MIGCQLGYTPVETAARHGHLEKDSLRETAVRSAQSIAGNQLAG